MGPDYSFTRGKSDCIFLIYLGGGWKWFQWGKCCSAKKITKNNNRFETHLSGALFWCEPLGGLSCRWHMTSLGPSCSLLTQPLGKRYSLLQLDFFKETAHFANQPNTLSTVRVQHSINTNLTNKSFLFLASTKTRNNVKVWRTPSLVKGEKKHLNFNRREMSAKQTAPLGQSTRITQEP